MIFSFLLHSTYTNTYTYLIENNATFPEIKTMSTTDRSPDFHYEIVSSLNAIFYISIEGEQTKERRQIKGNYQSLNYPVRNVYLHKQIGTTGAGLFIFWMLLVLPTQSLSTNVELTHRKTTSALPHYLLFKFKRAEKNE